MKRYYKSLDILIEAFLKSKLKHNNICACAVGNMVQFHTNENISDSDDDEWYSLLRNFNTTNHNIGKKQLASLPYTISEIIKIEKAFEDVLYEYCDRDGFHGLCNVSETLYQLEDWKEEESKVNIIEMCSKSTI